MVDADLHLKAVCSFAVWTHHHAGVVDEDVKSELSCRRTEWTCCGLKPTSLVCLADGQTGLTLVDGFSKLSYGLALRQIQFHAHDILVARALDDVFDGCLGSVHVTASHDDLCPCGGQNQDRRES